MSKKLLKSIENIMQNTGSETISIMTQYLKIEGKIFMPEGKCEECNEDYLTLQDARVCRLKDYCECGEHGCECNDYACFHYEWLNVAENKIVAFSVI